MGGRCAWPQCDGMAAGHNVFCCDHHFRIAPAQARALIRLKIEASRTPSQEVREHLTQQIAGYAASAVRAAMKTETHHHGGGKSAA